MSEFDNPAVMTAPSLPAYDGKQIATWTPPSLDLSQTGEASVPAGLDAWGKFGDAFGAAYQAQQLAHSSNSRDLALSEAVAERNKAVKQATGQDLEDPTRDGYLAEAVQMWRDQTGNQPPTPFPGQTAFDITQSLPEAMQLRKLQLQVYQQKLDALAQQYPQTGNGGGDILTQAQMLANEAVDRADETAKAAGGPLGFLAGLTGGIAGSWRDPLQVAALFLGAGEANGARSVAGQYLETFARHAAVNAGVTAATEPQIAAWAQQRGRPMSASDALYDIGLSALFGGGLGTAGHAVGELVARAGQGDAAAARQLADRLKTEAAPQAAADIAPVLRAVQDDATAAEGAPKELPPEDGAALARNATRSLEREDVPLPGQTPEASAEARADALPGAASRLLGEPEPPAARTLDTVRETEPPAPPLAIPASATTQRPSPPRMPPTLLAFLKAEGGVMDQGGELSAMDLRTSYPGLINNRSGLPLDEARKIAAEAGYFGGDIDRHMAETTVDDLLRKIREHPTYSELDQGKIDAFHEHRQGVANRAALREARATLTSFAKSAELGDIDKEWHERAAEILAAEGGEPDNALERAAIELYNERAERERMGEPGLPMPEIDYEQILRGSDNETYGGPRDDFGPGEEGADRGAPEPVSDAGGNAPTPEPRGTHDGLGEADILNATPVERDGKLEMLAPGEAARPNERVGFMAQLIENCVL